MAAVGDFVAPDEDLLDEPMNPVVFGVELTPTIIGILLALVGIGGAVYLFIKMVKPVAEQNDTLRAEIVTKQQQLTSQASQLEDIAKIEAELEVAMQRRRNVYSLFANEETMDTLLLDINQRIESSNAALVGTKNQVRSRGIPPILLEAQLKSFSPKEKVVVSDSSLGAEINGKLRREVYDIKFSGDYAQTQNILRNLERLEPLLMVRNFSVTSGSTVEETVIGASGQVVKVPKAQLETSFQLDALMPTADADVPPDVSAPAESAPAEGG